MIRTSIEAVGRLHARYMHARTLLLLVNGVELLKVRVEEIACLLAAERMGQEKKKSFFLL